MNVGLRLAKAQSDKWAAQQRMPYQKTAGLNCCSTPISVLNVFDNRNECWFKARESTIRQMGSAAAHALPKNGRVELLLNPNIGFLNVFDNRNECWFKAR